MHSGFQALRARMPMNLRKTLPGMGRGRDVAVDIERVLAIWTDCRMRYGAAGSFPVRARLRGRRDVHAGCHRFRTYAVELDEVSQAYVDAVLLRPDFVEWHEAALEEPWVITEDEV